MREQKAYADSNGGLHTTINRAVEADLNSLFAEHGVQEPAHITRKLTSDPSFLTETLRLVQELDK